MKVAVTGAAGYIGLNVLRALLDRGDEVVAIDRLQSPRIHDDRLSWATVDVLDTAALTRAMAGADLVIHLAAIVTLAAHDDLAWRVNTDGVHTAACAALEAGVPRFVHCSSVHAYDQHRTLGLLDETSVRSTHDDLPVYDRSKYAGEVALLRVVERGLDAVICNPTGTYGPVDYGLSRINSLLRDAAAGQLRVAVSGGFDLVDARDIAAGLLLAAERGRTGENYLLSGHPVAMLDALRIAARVVGRRGPAFAVPVRPIVSLLPILEPIGRRLRVDELSQAAMGALLADPIVDGAKARRELGYVPRQTVETIQDLVEFLIETGQLPAAGRT